MSAEVSRQSQRTHESIEFCVWVWVENWFCPVFTGSAATKSIPTAHSKGIRYVNSYLWSLSLLDSLILTALWYLSVSLSLYDSSSQKGLQATYPLWFQVIWSLFKPDASINYVA